MGKLVKKIGTSEFSNSPPSLNKVSDSTGFLEWKDFVSLISSILPPQIRLSFPEAFKLESDFEVSDKEGLST